MKTVAVLMSLVALLLVAGCASAPGAGGGAEVAKLAEGIRALGPEVDPEEAARAAEIAYSWSQHLAVEYEVVYHRQQQLLGIVLRLPAGER